MLKRTLTGAVILLVTVAFILLKQFNSLYFDAFALIMLYASLFEVINAYKKAGKKPHTALLMVAPILIFAGNCAARRIYSGSTEKIIFGSLFCMIMIYVLLLICLLSLDIIIASINRTQEEQLEENQASAFDSAKLSMQILAYPVLPLSFFFMLNSLPYDLSFIGIILTFAVAMMTDTFAYLFGKFFGKRKFIPEISPKKTIAGVVGGLIGGIVAAALVFVFVYFTPYFNILNKVSLATSIIAFSLIALIGSYITQLGDLIASALKRKVGIKDYSNIFPGHGGFMDRVDGQMFVSIFVWLALVIFFV